MTTRPFRFGLQAFAADSAIEWKDLARKAEVTTSVRARSPMSPLIAPWTSRR